MSHPRATCRQRPLDQQTAVAAAAPAEIAAAAAEIAAVGVDAAEVQSRGLVSLDKLQMDRFPDAGIPHRYISDLKHTNNIASQKKQFVYTSTTSK